MVKVSVVCPGCGKQQKAYMLTNSEAKKIRKKLGQKSVNLVETLKKPCDACQEKINAVIARAEEKPVEVQA